MASQGARRRREGPIRFRTSFRNTIYDVMLARGWVEVDEDTLEADPTAFDFAWDERGDLFAVYDAYHLDSWIRVCHFRNTRELCRKDLLAKNIKKARRAAEKEGKGDEWDFTPLTYLLPGEYALFAEEFKKAAHAGAAWIMKPSGRSQGQGIFLLTKLSQVSAWKNRSLTETSRDAITAGTEPPEPYVVQKYIADPYTIGGKKFDMRLYALVTSFAPMTVYLYRAGFCRFTTARYDASDFENAFVHLTNVAVQKNAPGYAAGGGGKWEVNKLKQYLITRHGFEAANAAFTGMQNIILHSLQSVRGIMMADKRCFELYGYDIMLDSSLKPWLLEVNASPSLTASSADDYNLKYKMLHDVLDLVDMEGQLAAAGIPPVPSHLGGFDLVWREPGGAIVNLDGDPAGLGGGVCVHGTMLGAEFDRRLNVIVPTSASAPRKDGEEECAPPSPVHALSRDGGGKGGTSKVGGAVGAQGGGGGGGGKGQGAGKFIAASLVARVSASASTRRPSSHAAPASAGAGGAVGAARPASSSLPLPLAQFGVSLPSEGRPATAQGSQMGLPTRSFGAVPYVQTQPRSVLTPAFTTVSQTAGLLSIGSLANLQRGLLPLAPSLGTYNLLSPVSTGLAVRGTSPSMAKAHTMEAGVVTVKGSSVPRVMVQQSSLRVGGSRGTAAHRGAWAGTHVSRPASVHVGGLVPGSSGTAVDPMLRGAAGAASVALRRMAALRAAGGGGSSAGIDGWPGEG